MEIFRSIVTNGCNYVQVTTDTAFVCLDEENDATCAAVWKLLTVEGTIEHGKEDPALQYHGKQTTLVDRKLGTPIGTYLDDDDGFKSDYDEGVTTHSHSEGTIDMVGKLVIAKDVVNHMEQLAVGGEYYGGTTDTLRV